MPQCESYRAIPVHLQPILRQRRPQRVSTQLVQLQVLKRDDLMFQATADSAEAAREVAEAVVARLWKKAP
jgi:hypothetical protein